MKIVEFSIIANLTFLVLNSISLICDDTKFIYRHQSISHLNSILFFPREIILKLFVCNTKLILNCLHCLNSCLYTCRLLTLFLLYSINHIKIIHHRKPAYNILTVFFSFLYHKFYMTLVSDRIEGSLFFLSMLADSLSNCLPVAHLFITFQPI